MNKNTLSLTLALLPLVAFGAVAGCQNTAEGVAQDTSNASQAVSDTAEKTGEAAAKATQDAGQKMAKTADDATKAGSEAGKNVAGALQVTPLVKTAIAADTELNDSKNKIDVDTMDGVVHLKGHVASDSLKARATRIAQERIKENNGTDKVVNELVVQP